MPIKSIQQANLNNKKVVLRVDYNVPLKNGKVSDDTRIRESLATIKELLKRRCSLVIISHLGRPDGKASAELSLAPVAKKLQQLLRKKILFLSSKIDQRLISYCQKLKPGQIVMLENIRFYPEEEKNDSKFAKKLSDLGQIYVDDAFGCAHRAHASIHAITQFIPSYAGLLLQKEVEKLSLVFRELDKPATFIIGGAKIDTKIELIKNFAGRMDNFLFGGGIANTFLAAKKYQLANSLVQKDMIDTAKTIELAIRRKNKNIYLPVDFALGKKLGNFVLAKNFRGTKVPPGYSVFDIGKQAARDFAQIIGKSKTIIWNGPMGVSEYRPFRKGTRIVAEAIAKATRQGATTILGGGDTLEAIKTLRLPASKFTHVSTGGGAMLEFLEKGTLPGLEVLET